MTERTPEEIAAGLTEAQREALIYVARKQDWREEAAFRMHEGAAGVNAARQMHEIGLLDRKDHWLRYLFGWDRDYRASFRLTPLGLAVRTLIEKDSRRGG